MAPSRYSLADGPQPFHGITRRFRGLNTMGETMGWLSRLLGADDRNRELAAWGQAIPVTALQSDAMREIWLAAKAGAPPVHDPLSRLSQQDCQYIKTICSADFRPPQFGSANIMRMEQFHGLMARGFTAEQAAVVVGMTFNMVGPTDL